MLHFQYVASWEGVVRWHGGHCRHELGPHGAVHWRGCMSAIPRTHTHHLGTGRVVANVADVATTLLALRQHSSLWWSLPGSGPSIHAQTSANSRHLHKLIWGILCEPSFCQTLIVAGDSRGQLVIAPLSDTHSSTPNSLLPLSPVLRRIHCRAKPKACIWS